MLNAFFYVKCMFSSNWKVLISVQTGSTPRLTRMAHCTTHSPALTHPHKLPPSVPSWPHIFVAQAPLLLGGWLPAWWEGVRPDVLVWGRRQHDSTPGRSTTQWPVASVFVPAGHALLHATHPPSCPKNPDACAFKWHEAEKKNVFGLKHVNSLTKNVEFY